MAINTMQAQAMNAQNNPNIISDITGAPQQSTLQNQPAAPPAAAAPQTQAVNQATTAVPALGNMQNVAVSMANQMYGSGMVGGMESQRNAMMTELKDYDSMLSKIYEGQSYFPKVEGYVDNPADRVSSLAGVSGQTGSDIGRTSATIDSTERAYNMAISAVMDRFMDFYKMQEDQKRWEKEYELEQKKAGLAGDDDVKDQQALAVLFGADPEAVASGNVLTTLASASQSQGGPTLQSLKLATLLNPKGAAKYQSIYGTYNPGGGGMNSTLQSKVLTNQATLRQVEDLWSLYRQIPGYQKGVLGQGQMGSFFGPLSGENLAGQFDEMRKVVATNIARSVYGETGPVTDKDIERIAESLPSRFETETKAGQKYSRLYSNLQQGINDVNTMASGGGSSMLATNPTYYPQSSLAPTQATATDLTDKEIPVEEIRSGMRGWIKQSEFDPNQYKRL